ncbi:MAG: hypothetical protein KatS3mg050_0954 [Litorilinea sp.]|nr:MAG: hypothetical protein KatS3mg050_0954 [Litorilinea sp.]
MHTGDLLQEMILPAGQDAVTVCQGQTSRPLVRIEVEGAHPVTQVPLGLSELVGEDLRPPALGLLDQVEDVHTVANTQKVLLPTICAPSYGG